MPRLVLALCAYSEVTLAESQDYHPATLKVAMGQPLVISFADGREAVIKMYSITHPRLSVKFKITDNTCSNRQGMQCALKLELRTFHMTPVWTKNPDAGRLGKSLVRKGPPEQSLEDSVGAFSGLTAGEVYPSLTEGLPLNELECEDWSWLPGGKKHPPKTLHISHWAAETNETNPETKFNENRIASGAYGMDLVKSSPKSMLVKKVARTIDESDIGIVDENGSIVLMDQRTNQTCQVGFGTVGLADLSATILDTENKIRPPLDQVPPYIFGGPLDLTRSAARSINYWGQLNQEEVN